MTGDEVEAALAAVRAALVRHAEELERLTRRAGELARGATPGAGAERAGMVARATRKDQA